MTLTAAALGRRLPALAIVHLVPGVLLLLFWAATAPLLQAVGAPTVLGLLLGVPAVLLPAAAVVLRRTPHSSVSAAGPALGCRRMSRTAVVGRVVPLGLAAVLLPGAVAPLEPGLRSVIAPHLPAWFDPGAESLFRGSAVFAAPTLVAWVLCAVLLGPVLEELVFRGALQPLLPGGRVGRVLLGTLLFTLYHLWQPWAWPTTALASLPLAVLRETRAGTTGAIAVHVGTNAVVLPMLLTGLLQR